MPPKGLKLQGEYSDCTTVCLFPTISNPSGTRLIGNWIVKSTTWGLILLKILELRVVSPTWLPFMYPFSNTRTCAEGLKMYLQKFLWHRFEPPEIVTGWGLQTGNKNETVSAFQRFSTGIFDWSPVQPNGKIFRQSEFMARYAKRKSDFFLPKCRAHLATRRYFVDKFAGVNFFFLVQFVNSRTNLLPSS